MNKFNLTYSAISFQICEGKAIFQLSFILLYRNCILKRLKYDSNKEDVYQNGDCNGFNDFEQIFQNG